MATRLVHFDTYPVDTADVASIQEAFRAMLLDPSLFTSVAPVQLSDDDLLSVERACQRMVDQQTLDTADLFWVRAVAFQAMQTVQFHQQALGPGDPGYLHPMSEEYVRSGASWRNRRTTSLHYSSNDPMLPLVDYRSEGAYLILMHPEDE